MTQISLNTVDSLSDLSQTNTPHTRPDFRYSISPSLYITVTDQLSKHEQNMSLLFREHQNK